ncbi:Hypothetical predicted protein [Podarcis lilfordi]|uniref:Uncharacterized protein n=1 Tax=Podarcis lilfordi TaxID=74358 RepID=A0AA35LN41_9SAUR|nr:Hypothetical predicted protein [Podarcis lilfordi]
MADAPSSYHVVDRNGRRKRRLPCRQINTTPGKIALPAVLTKQSGGPRNQPQPGMAPEAAEISTRELQMKERSSQTSNLRVIRAPICVPPRSSPEPRANGTESPKKDYVPWGAVKKHECSEPARHRVDHAVMSVAPRQQRQPRRQSDPGSLLRCSRSSSPAARPRLHAIRGAVEAAQKHEARRGKQKSLRKYQLQKKYKLQK